MANLFCVRADFGTYTEKFVAGGYIGLGWIPEVDLSGITAREQLYPLYKTAHPDDKSNIVIGQQVGQIARFLLDIKADDYVITPALDTEFLCYGTVGPIRPTTILERRTGADTITVGEYCGQADG